MRWMSSPPPLDLKSEGKAHFDCKDLEGVELENQGDSGTALQHWEKRVLGVSSVRVYVCVCHFTLVW